jgi:hypothetical protein
MPRRAPPLPPAAAAQLLEAGSSAAPSTSSPRKPKLQPGTRLTSFDKFLTSFVRGTPASDSEWARNVTAADAASEASGSGTRAATSEPHTAARSPPRRRLGQGVLRACPRRSCELFYIFGRRIKSGPSLEKQAEVIVLLLNPHACFVRRLIGFDMQFSVLFLSFSDS